jgi:glycosyltransferase involved in cell wall biosynthesis
MRIQVPLVTFIYGIEAWKPTRRIFVNFLARRKKHFVSISQVTKDRFLSWSRVGSESVAVLPNAVHSDVCLPGPKDGNLSAKLGLDGGKTIMTMGRLVSKERAKGFDVVLESLPALLKELPNLTYVIVGDGADRQRLEQKARALGVEREVRFVGYVEEERKTDYLRLADAFVMPSRGEGFGFVLLEAMACGIPVVASSEDGGREAVRDGRLGLLVNPDSPKSVIRGILEALNGPRGRIPTGLEYFSFDNFTARTHEIVVSSMSSMHRKEEL